MQVRMLQMKTGGHKIYRCWIKSGPSGVCCWYGNRSQDYNRAKGVAKKAISKARNAERKKFCEDLDVRMGRELC